MMDDEKFDSVMAEINLDFFWHELGKDPEVMVFCPPTPPLNRIFQFYENYLQPDQPLVQKLSPEGERTLDLLSFMIDLHVDGLIPAREVVYRLRDHAATLKPARHFRDVFYEQAKPIPAPNLIPAPTPTPKPTPARLLELRERLERKAEEEADRNFDELMREEDARKAVRKKKKCKRKSRAQRRKPPPYELAVHDGDMDMMMMNGPPPPAYTPFFPASFA